MRLLGRAAAVAAIAGAIAAPPAAAGRADLGRNQSSITLPARAAFYYPWYPEVWAVDGIYYPHFTPSLGYYSSASTSAIDAHISALDYAHVDVAIASWWDIGRHEQSVRIPLLFARTEALGSPLRWALYYEKESHEDPTVPELEADLAYIGASYATRPGYADVGGKPVIFVYNPSDQACPLADRWAEAAAGAWYVVLLVLPGFRDCPNQPASWHDYKPAHAEDSRPGYSFSISPGFWLAKEAAPRLERDLTRWRDGIRNMIASNAPWQLITTFNEWGEGTAVERANDWATSSYGPYLDALHDNGQVPTAVSLRATSATRTRSGVVVRWRTASESGLLGFHVYRERSGKRVRLTRELIASVFGGTKVGHRYSWVDRGAFRRVAGRYWLETVGTGGTRSWHGPLVAG